MRAPSAPFPTLPHLGVQKLPEDVDAVKIATEWLDSFASRVESSDIDGVLNLFIDDCFWRDLLALTWDFRTLDGSKRVRDFLTERLSSAQITSLKLKSDAPPTLERPYEDIAWITAFFEFETKVGLCSGIFRLVPLSDGQQWKAHCMLTNLEDLKGFPEKLGHLRDHAPNHGHWLPQREIEREFSNGDPTVVIVGGGQSGLELAARLKCLDVPCLVIEKNTRVGDNWRNRYEALCLHDPVWYDHMPYMPFPPTWPVFTPALKLANWLEGYSEAMELNVWTSSTVTNATQDETSKKWTIKVTRDSKERTVNANHLVFATGLGGGKPNFPSYPGMTDVFKGKILHSTAHGKALDHAGKRVVVIGACTSAHDICVDYADHGVDVTMYQRSSTYIMSTKRGMKLLFSGLFAEDGPPTHYADRINASFPNLMRLELSQRQTRAIAEVDRETLENLKKRGFRTNMGMMDGGFLYLAWAKAGGYYLDVGGSQYIIDGKIKLKNDSLIQSFTETGLKFEDGSELPADVVIFSTGIGNTKDIVEEICGPEVGNKCKKIWGLDDEGEINGAWRDLGVDNLWYMMGNLALCRFHSKHVALQIKAIEEGIFGTRYSADEN